MANVFFIAVVEGDRETGYSVYFPDLPGLATAGDTIQHAAEQAHQALAFHLAGMIEDGVAIPEPTPIEDIAYDPEVREVARILVSANLPSTRTVRVNVTLPEDLVHRIDRTAPNRSRFLAEAAEKALMDK